MEYQTLAIAVPPQDPESAEATWALPEGWAEVPNERFTSNDIEYAVVSIPKNADTTGYTTGPAPMTCIDGQITANGTPIATCPHACPGIRGLFPVELAGREACHREFIYPDPPENNLEGMIEGAVDGDEQEPVVPTP